MYLTAEGKAVTQSSDESFARAFIREVNNDLNDVKHSFIKIGFRLTEANNYEYYKELGYENIIELAEAEFGFKKTTTYELMRVYELAYDRANCMYISKRFDKFTYSQLSVLSYAKYVGSAFWDIVKPTDSVRDLKRFVSNWNEEYKNGCGYHPELKTVKEYLEAYDEKRTEEQKQISEYAGQLPGQIAIDEEPVEEEFSERSEKSVQEKEVSETAVTPMTDSELIEHVIKRGSAYLDGKFRIVEFYNSAESPTHEQFKNYVRNDYGSGYFSGDNYCQRVEFNGADGLIITRKTGGQIILAWAVVAGNISRLITADKYLSDVEKDKYLQWKEQRSRLKAEPTQEQSEAKRSESNEEISERSEEVHIQGISNLEFLKNACCYDFAKLVSERIRSIPDSFGEGMPDRLTQWLCMWLMMPHEDKEV